MRTRVRCLDCQGWGLSINDPKVECIHCDGTGWVCARCWPSTNCECEEDDT